MLPLILSVSQQLAQDCHAIRFTRSAATRHTHIQHCMMRAAIPLKSLTHRLRRGLVQRGEGEEQAFTAFAYATLLRFHSDLLDLFRALDNRARRTQSLVALVERTAVAVSMVQEMERSMILGALNST